MILPRTNIKVNKGFFIPVNLELIARTNLKTAAVYGAVLRFALMKNKSGDINGYCYASIGTIAGDLDLTRMTVIKYLDILREDNHYIIDNSSGIVNKTHHLRVNTAYKNIAKSQFFKVDLGLIGVLKSFCKIDFRAAKPRKNAKKNVLPDTKKPRMDTVKPLIAACVYGYIQSICNIEGAAVSKTKITEKLNISLHEVTNCLIVLKKCNLITIKVKSKKYLISLA